MDKYTIGDFVRDLKKDSRKLFDFIYKTYYPHVRAFILKNKGNEQDIKDIFQEGVIAVIKNIENKTADLDAPFVGYLYSICRYIWNRNYRSKETITLNEEDLSGSYSIEEENTNEIDEVIETGIYQRNFLKLGEKCRDLLRLTLEKVPAKEIAEKFGFKSENFVFKRKHQCKEQLIRMIKEDPDYIRYMKNK
ncbi:MAG: sigma-70 family RNA polymerase sigma factor [Bacteroidales bacterium]|nr:sigma-70 family RNA polymerase sigma factor [Bacteroidales bacterium]